MNTGETGEGDVATQYMESEVERGAKGGKRDGNAN